MQLQQRSPEQVLEAHLAAFRSGNAALIACDFAKDAMLILPGSVAQGPDPIQATFAGFFQAAGAINSVTVTSTTTQGGSILMTYKVDSEHIVVSDGVDTFVIEKGRIVLETVYLRGGSRHVEVGARGVPKWSVNP
jgi:ketosteroid isomerase-like protein